MIKLKKLNGNWLNHKINSPNPQKKCHKVKIDKNNWLLIKDKMNGFKKNNKKKIKRKLIILVKNKSKKSS